MTEYQGIQAEQTSPIPIACPAHHAQKIDALADSRPWREIPAGPRPTPVLGWRLEQMKFALDPVGYMARLYKKYGAVTAWGTERPRVVFAFDPKLNELMFSDQRQFHWAVRPKWQYDSNAMHVLSYSIFNIPIEHYHQRRQILRRPMESVHFDRWRDTIVRLTNSAMEDWQPGKTVDMHRRGRELVHGINMSLLFSIEDRAIVDRVHDCVFSMANSGPAQSILFLYRYNLPGSKYRKLLANATEMEAFLRGVVRKRKAQPTNPEPDMLDLLLSSWDKYGEGLSEDDLVGELYNLVNSENITAGLTWTLFLLAQHPKVCADLVDELQGALHGEAPTYEQVGRLPLLDKVYKESFRLLPPSPFRRRYTAEACQFGPYELPKGATLISSQYVTHRLPEIYPEPQRFLPSRWDTIRPTPFEYFPFGAPSRYCIAKGFAPYLIKTIIATVLQRYRLTVAPGSRINRHCRLSLELEPTQMPMVISRQDRNFTRSPIRGDVLEMVDFA
jgi:cytochrome P450